MLTQVHTTAAVLFTAGGHFAQQAIEAKRNVIASVHPLLSIDFQTFSSQVLNFYGDKCLPIPRDDTQSPPRRALWARNFFVLVPSLMNWPRMDAVCPAHDAGNGGDF